MKGKSVYLRPIRQSDMESFYRAVHDEEIRYMTGTRAAFTMEQLHAHYESITNDPTRFDLAICLEESSEILGDLSILDIDETNHKAGFRIALHSTKHVNKGYGTESVRLALDFAFCELKLNRLQLEVFSHNIRGIKSYEKAGFKLEGRLRQSICLNGHYSDELIMGMLREEYVELKQQDDD